MESLRRARFIWAVLCMLIGYGLAVALLFSTYRPDLMKLYTALMVWCATWLWLPLYMKWTARKVVACMWFLGFTPLWLLTPSPAPAILLFSGLGGVALAVHWIAAGSSPRS